ncbi:MAG: DUF1684 domain-containing protein [Acidobacteriota bacterium]
MLVSPTETEHRAAIEAWRARRGARLVSDSGWLTVVGLSWLEQGENAIGSDPGAAVVLPEGPAPRHVGRLVVAGERVRAEIDEAAGATHRGQPIGTIELLSDRGGAASPTTLELGSLAIHVIERAGKLAVRVRDRESRARRAFTGIESYPIALAWRLEGTFQPAARDVSIAVPTILGFPEPRPVLGHAHFTIDGGDHRLLAVREPGTDDLFFVFGDATNGAETYGGGRFLYAPPPVGGAVAIDFNMAYNPPCVFTRFATCPLPPPGNRLPIRVVAGERIWSGEPA